MSPRFLLFAAAVMAAAPMHGALAQSAPASPKTTEIDPVGTYELSIVVQGTTMGSTVKIEKKADATLGGSVATEAYGTFPIEAVKVSGKTITISLSTQDGGAISIALTVEGDQVTGEWSMANDGSKITGKKLPPA
jgi:hypothetical protein